MTTLDDIGACVTQLAETIGAPRNLLPAVGPAGGAYATTRLAVLDDGSLAYMTSERDQISRQTTRDLDELLYWAFAPVCFNMAMSWESRHRVPAIDFRALAFARELYLPGRHRPAWPHRHRPDLAEVLRKHPYAGEDLPEAAATVRTYHAAHPNADGFAPAELVTLGSTNPATTRRLAA